MTTSRPARGVARWVIETRQRFKDKSRGSRRDFARSASSAATVKPVIRATPLRKFAAWCVHFYTALGQVCAVAMVVSIFQGDARGFQSAFFWMIVATIIDATDGTFARKVGVKQVLPGFDGRRLDDITDFLTYTFLPLLLLWRAGTLPPGQEAWLIFPLLASAYGFCQTDIKTADGYFLGFPSLWNVVALYIYILGMPTWVNLAIVVVLSILTFVPTRYLYPSQPGPLNRLATILSVVWIAALVPVIMGLAQLDAERVANPSQMSGLRLLAYGTLFYPIFYMVVSFWITLRMGRRGFGHTSHTA